MIYSCILLGSGIRQLVQYLSFQLHCQIIIYNTLLIITLVLLSVCRFKSPYLYCLSNHLDKGKSISLFQRIQGCYSLLIIVHDKNLEFTTKLRIVTCYLLVLIYYLAVEFHMVHTFYILSTYSNLSTIFLIIILSSILSPLSYILCPLF